MNPKHRHICLLHVADCCSPGVKEIIPIGMSFPMFVFNCISDGFKSALIIPIKTAIVLSSFSLCQWPVLYYCSFHLCYCLSFLFKHKARPTFFLLNSTIVIIAVSSLLIQQIKLESGVDIYFFCFSCYLLYWNFWKNTTKSEKLTMYTGLLS